MNSINLSGEILMGNTMRRVTKNGKEFIEFFLKVKRYTDPMAEKTYYDFIRCRAWGKTADYILINFATGDWMTLTGSYYIDKYGEKPTYWHYVSVAEAEGKRLTDIKPGITPKAKKKKEKREETPPDVSKIKW